MKQQATHIFTNLVNNFAGWWSVFEGFAYLAGFVLVIIGIYRIAHATQGVYAKSVGGGTLAGALPAICGAGLLALPEVMSMLTYTVFEASAPRNALAYLPNATGEAGSAAIRFAIFVIHMVGLYAVIKGIMLMARAHEDREAFAAGAWMIIGGAIALRIDLFAGWFSGQAGGAFQSVVENFFM